MAKNDRKKKDVMVDAELESFRSNIKDILEKGTDSKLFTQTKDQAALEKLIARAQARKQPSVTYLQILLYNSHSLHMLQEIIRRLFDMF